MPASARKRLALRHEGRLARRADPAGVRRLRPRPRGSLGHHGRDQPLRRQRRRMPRPDVQHGHAAAARLGRAEAPLPSEDRERRTAPPVDGRDRAHDRHRHDEAQDDRSEARRPLRRERPEGLDLAHPALRPDDPARAHDAARGGEAQVGRHVDLHRRPARIHREGPHRAADPEHGEPRDERAVLRESFFKISNKYSEMAKVHFKAFFYFNQIQTIQYFCFLSLITGRNNILNKI